MMNNKANQNIETKHEIDNKIYNKKPAKKSTGFVVGVSLIACILILILSAINQKKSVQFMQDNELSSLQFYVIEGNQRTLLFTGTDIEEFDWDNQTVQMKQEFLKTREDNYGTQSSTSLENAEGSVVLGVSYDKKFALFLKERLLYEGDFEQSIAYSYIPLGIYIGDIVKDGDMTDTFSINNTNALSTTDLRFNKKLKKLLKAYKLLKN